jgi:2-C-methyl-D-erythritol 4-phosphate cytidylyltransferase
LLHFVLFGGILKVYAIVLAAGSGVRMGAPTPKQFIKIAGKTVLEHTLASLDASDAIDEIIVTSHADHFERTRSLASASNVIAKLTVVVGGKTRNESTYLALAAIPEQRGKVLIHDAVRPFLRLSTISRVVKSLDLFHAVDTAIASADTIVEVDQNDVIQNIPERSRLLRGQTPQGFQLESLRKAYAAARRDGKLDFPDDCSVFMHYLPNEKVKVIRGESSNIKLTDPFDLIVAEKIFHNPNAAVDVLAGPARLLGLCGKHLVIFGASSGIGLELAIAAEEHGAVVHSFSRSLSGTHVESAESVRAAIAQVTATGAQIDFVVNTAATLLVSPLHTMSDDQIDQTIDINFKGHINVMRASLPALLESGGALLGFASSSYTRGRSNYSLYSATKAALVNLTQAVADEHRLDGVRLNLISPERTSTPMRTAAFGDEPEDSMLESKNVALATLDALLSTATGMVLELRVESWPVTPPIIHSGVEQGSVSKSKGNWLSTLLTSPITVPTMMRKHR